MEIFWMEWSNWPLVLVTNTLIIQKIRDIVSEIGTDGLIWTFFLILGIVMVGLYKPAVAITVTIGGIIFIGILGLASIPIVSIIAIIVMGGFLLWSMRGWTKKELLC